FRVPPNMVFLRSPGCQDLINFVGTKKPVSADDSLQHFGFKTTKAGLTKVEKKLKENEIKVEGRRGRQPIYFRDPNGYTLDYYFDEAKGRVFRRKRNENKFRHGMFATFFILTRTTLHSPPPIPMIVC